MRRMRGWAVLTASVLAATCTACTGDGSADAEAGTKAGGSDAPVTLTLASPDFPGQPGMAQAEEFARTVAKLSGRRIRIELVPEAAGVNVPGFEVEVAQKAADGELDLALVASRAWASLDVTSLQALTAPFLVTDPTRLTEVVTGDLVEKLTSGLSDVGLVGLGLWPESLRHPFAIGEPLLAPEDYAGKDFRAPPAVTTTAMFEALGATTNFISGPAYDVAAAKGRVDGAESALSVGMPAPSVATGNVTFFPKVNVLVITEAAADELGENRLELLSEAADATRDWAITQMPDEADAAQSFCDTGGTVVLASATQVTAMEEAMAPVYAQLEQDELTAELIGAIDELPESSAAGDDLICAPDPSKEMPASSGGTKPAIADGVYRYEVPVDYLVDNGIDPSQAAKDAGTTTVTMKDGVYTEQWRNEVSGEVTCTGTYVVVGSRMFMQWTPGGGCVGAWAATATVDDGTVTWSEIQAMPPDPPELTADWEVYLGKPWTRIGDVDE
jgi:TRAP-type C4-dicarboxylate transport system substrate-binding protein